MTHTTPPGWYPDPGHEGAGPRSDRWWDGSAWTDEVRAAAPPAWGPPGAPPYPAYPVSPLPASRNRGRRIAVGVTAVVVVMAVAGGFYLLGRDGGHHSEAGRPGSAAAPTPPGQEGRAPDGPPGRGGPGSGGNGDGEDGGGNGGGGGRPGQPPAEDGYATDAASGISIPVPDGWTGQSGVAGAGVTTAPYACPGDTAQQCVRGGVFSVPAAALEIAATTAKATAEQDIEANSEESYGGTTYGTISSHQQLKSEAVTVAGQKGYLVRWKVVTSKGDDGYVQSLAFPSPTTPDLMVVVRSGFDVNAKAPQLSVMDEIVKGIKAAAGSGRGNGQGI
ncbi:DUF2510 domain-containing protein [Streptomyces sp. NPDC051569]|uniref:DUF2510 domain-containing protein n=1 Tax=Streptomyces sp. NPDC051569 TaxID=3365661 RepID=UPI0037B9528C